MGLDPLRDLAAFIQKLDGQTIDLNDAYLLMTSSEIRLVHSDGRLITAIQMLGDDPVGWVLDLGIIIRTLRERVESPVPEPA